MTLFQIILLVATAFFAYKVYEHVQSLQDERTRGRVGNEPVPADPQDLVEQADASYKAGDLFRARRLLEDAERLQPDDPEILNRLAYVLAKTGESGGAVEKYERSLAVEDDDVTHNALASVLKSEGRFDEAEKHYEAALAIDDRYEVTYYNYGNLLAERGDTEGAKQMYKKALAIREDFAEAREELEKLS
jgi:tetratricopeptide (TPR) repeat protein